MNNARQMRIMEILPDLDIGGIQRLVTQLSSELAQRGHAVKLVAFHKGGPLLEQALGVEVEIWNLEPYRVRKLARRVEQESKTFQADIIHAHPGLSARLGAFRAGIPAVSTYHTAMTTRSWIPAFWDRYLAKRTAALVAISHAVKRHWESRLKTDRFDVIYNGIDLTQFNKIPERSALKEQLGWKGSNVIYLGRLHQQKGADVLLRAWAELQRRGDWHLQVIGSGPEEYKLLKLVEKLGITQSVSFMGESLQPDIMLSAADLAVVPSRSAAFELVAVEAMAAGCPLITSDADALPEVTNNAATSFAAGDFHDLATKMDQLLSDSKLMDNLSSKGLLRAKEFDLKLTVDKYEELYSTIVRS